MKEKDTSKLREIKLICRGGFEANVEKVVYASVIGSDGRLERIPNFYFDRDPRGNWKFIESRQYGKGIGEFTLRETLEWENRTPSEVDAEILRRSPGINKKYGEDVPYVTLEEALMVFLKENKNMIKGKYVALVCTPEVVDCVRLLVDNGWPIGSVENDHLLNEVVKPVEVKKEEEPEPIKEKIPTFKKEKKTKAVA